MLRAYQVLLPLLLLLPACVPNTPVRSLTTTPASNTARATRTPRPTPTRLPDISVAEVVLKHGPGRDEVSVLGLVENLGREPLTDGLLLVHLYDGEDQLVQQKIVPIFLPHLQAHSVSPFSAVFDHATEGIRASVELASYTRIPVTPALLEPEHWSFVPLAGGGGVAVLGEITNTTEQSVSLHRLGFLVFGPGGEIQALSSAATHLSVLEPGELTPFIAELDRGVEGEQLKPYLDATASTTKKFPLDLSVEAAWLKRTPQGAPFLLGEISNAGYTATWARLLAVLRSGGELISVAPIDLPFPIPADERWPFSAPYLPGFESALLNGNLELEDIEIEVLIDAYARPDVEGAPLMLQFQISHYEPIGSTLVMRGQMTNNTDETVMAPTMYAALRSTGGDLTTVGWTRLPGSLESGESTPFTLNLPLSESAIPSTSEHDLLAIAFRAPNPQ